MQWVALWPRTKKLQDLNPRLGFPPKDIPVRLIVESKLPLDSSV